MLAALPFSALTKSSEGERPWAERLPCLRVNTKLHYQLARLESRYCGRFFRKGLHTMIVKPQTSSGNQLLDALPNDVYERLANHLKPVSFSLGEVVYEIGDKIDNLYFPTIAH